MRPTSVSKALWRVQVPTSTGMLPVPQLLDMSLTAQSPLDLCFTKLLNELRIKICKYALMLDHPIEFWPETGNVSKDSWQQFHARKHYERLFDRYNVCFRLLRTCRQIEGEAAEVFDGQNTSWFSGINGCIVATASMFTITSQHTQWLINTTIAMPLHSMDQSIYAHEQGSGHRQPILQRYARFLGIIALSPQPKEVVGVITKLFIFLVSDSARSTGSSSRHWCHQTTSSSTTTRESTETIEVTPLIRPGRSQGCRSMECYCGRLFKRETCCQKNSLRF